MLEVAVDDEVERLCNEGDENDEWYCSCFVVVVEDDVEEYKLLLLPG